MSPRKSSTSSAKPRARRPRYLGVVAHSDGPRPSGAREWERLLREALGRGGIREMPFRLIRVEGDRAIVEVGHLLTAEARTVWTGLTVDPTVTFSTARTWGTLKGAKAWLRRK